MSNYKEFLETAESLAPRNEGPIPGSLGGDPGRPPKNLPIKVRYYVAAMDDPKDRAAVEHLMTRSLRSGDALREVGDVCIFREDNTFDKEGGYFVVVKYAEVVDPDKDPQETKTDE